MVGDPGSEPPADAVRSGDAGAPLNRSGGGVVCVDGPELDEVKSEASSVGTLTDVEF